MGSGEPAKCLLTDEREPSQRCSHSSAKGMMEEWAFVEWVLTEVEGMKIDGED